jgi:hypothetical protein
MTFVNHSKRRKLTEEECRSLANAALIYLAEQQPDKKLVLLSSELMGAAFLEIGQHGLAVSISDDDAVVTIGAAARVLSDSDKAIHGLKE